MPLLILLLCACLLVPTAVLGQVPVNVPEDPLLQAAALEAAERFDEAELRYRQMLEDGEDGLEARFRLGRLYLRQGRLDEAIEMLESYRELAGDEIDEERRREVDARLDEAHVQRTAEWIAALERREAEPAAAFAFARRLVNSARLDDAERILGRLVDQTPLDPQAHYWLGQIYLRTQRFERGLEYLRESVELAPDNMALQLELGRAHAIAGNAEEAETIYRRVVEEANDARVIEEARRQLSLVRDVGALLGRAITLEEAERFEQAERLYQRLIDSGEIEGLEARFRLGRMLLGLERYDEAIAALGTFLAQAREVAPGGRLREAGALLNTAHEARAREWVEELARDDADTEAALDFGRRLVNIGRLDLARQVLEPLVTLVPDDPQAQYWLGQVYVRMERFEEGLAALERSAELAPENVTLKMALAQAYEAAGERGRAEAVYLEIDELAPDTPMAREARRRLNLGRAQRLIEASDWEGALEIFTRLLEEHPDDPRLLEQQARMYEALGRQEELEQVLQELLEQAPRDIGLLMRVAASYDRRGRDAQARELYVRVLGLEPDAETTRLALDRLGFERAVERLQAGDFTEAADLLERLQTVAPRVPILPLNLGIAYYGQQRFEEAEAAYRRALSLDENNLAARVQLAQLLDETGRLGESIEMMESALELTRTPQQNRQVRERLNTLYAREVDRVLEDVMQGESGFETLIGLARDLYRLQFDAGVARLLAPVLERFQDEPQIHFWLGRSLLRQGDLERGVAAIERSVELEPGNVALQAELGQAYLRAERWEDAERVLGQVAQQAPDADTFERADRNRRLARARGLEQEGDFEAALALYETMVEEQPGEERLALGQARMLLALNRGDEADEILESLLAQASGDVGFRLHLGSLYQQYGYPDRHEQMLLEALELAPDNVQVRANLGRLYLQAGRIEEGLEQVERAFDRLRQLGPGQPQVVELADSLTELLLRLGRGLTDQGRLDEAEQVLDRLVTIQPRNAQARYWLSKVYHEQEAFGQEVAELEQVVEAMPENLLMQRRLGLAYYHAEQQEQAIEALTAVLERFPFDSEVRYLLAETHRQLGAQEIAEAEYVRLLELNPGEEWRLKALDRLGLARIEEHLEQNQTAQALGLLRELLKQVPDDPLVNLALARAYHLADREDEAEMQYRRVLSLAPDDPDARLGLAGLLTDLDREDEAIDTYHALATDDPMLPQAEEAREALDELLLRKARRNLADVEAAVGEEAEPAARIARLLPLGIELFDLQGYAAALEVFEYLVGIAPDDAPSHYWLGRVYQEQDRHADAMVVLRHSVDLDPGNPRYLTALGVAYREEQLFRLAEEVLLQAKSLDPGEIEIAFELAELHQRRDRTDDAEAELLRIMEIAPEDEAVHRALAQLGLPEDPAQLDGDRLDAARELLSALPPGELRAPAANLYLAEIYQRHDRLADAEAAWRAVLAQAPGHPRAALALGRLYRATGRDDEALPLLSGVADGEGPQPMRREARLALVELLTQRSRAMIDRLERGEGDLDAARSLGMSLIQRQAFEEAVTLLEAAVARFPDDPQLHYWRGRAYRFVNRPNEGLSSLARSAGLAPDNMQLRHEFGIALQESRRVADARAIFEQVAVNAGEPELQQDATRRAAHMRALQLAETGDFALALREIDTALAQFPADVSLLGERGRILLQQGRIDEADRTFEHILSIEPESIGVRMRLAGVYRTRGETAKFLEQLAAVIAIAPESPQAAQARAQLGYNRGLELVEEEDLAGAQEIFERMLTVVPDDPAARFQLGRVSFLQRRLGEAEIHLIEVTQDDPAHQGAHLILGRVYEVMERWDNAMRSYERAVDLGVQTREGNEALSELTRLYGMRLQELMTTGREDDAIRGMQRIVDNNPENFAARMQLARLQFSTGRFEEGLAHMREVVRVRPGALPYRLMATAYRQTGQLREAVEAYARAIALETDPDQASDLALDLVLALSSQMLEENRPFAAIRHLQALHDSGLGSERTWYPLGVVYRQQGVFDEAARAFREALRTAPDNITIRFNLAELYQRTNDEELALIQYRDIVRRGEPGDRFVEEARRRADRLRDRVALFTSQLGYTMTIGESVIQEQDLTSTGAINSSFSSQLFYNLGTNFRPTDNFTLRLDTGFSYIGNHSTRTDSLVPRVGVSGDLNLTDHFYRASLHFSDNWDLMREAYLGRSISASASGGIRFTDPFALFRGWGVGRVTETGETRLQYAPADRFSSVLPEGNPGLRNRLREQALEASVDATLQSYQEGRRLLRQGRLEAAMDAFGRVLDTVPEDPLTRLGVGLIHERRGADDAAAEAYRAALDDAIAARPARLQLAALEAGAGRFDEAAAILEPLANEDMDTPERALARERLREYRAREGGLTVAEAHRSALDEAGFDRALDDLRSGRYRQALETLEGMLEVFPEDPLVWLNIGVAHQHLAEETQAEAAFQRVLDISPRNLNGQLRLGRLYAETGRPGRALTLLQRVASEGAGLEIGARARDELDRLERERLRALTGDGIEQGAPASKTLQWRLFYSDTLLPVTSLAETFGYGAGLTFAYSSLDYGNWSLSYTFGVRDNKEPLGTDYAYLSHDFGVNWQTRVPNFGVFGSLFGDSENIPGLTASLSLNRQQRDYLNVDTNALNVLGRAVHRSHVTNDLSASLNYQIPGHDRMNFSLSYSVGISDTDLPVGIVFNRQGTPIAFQSTGLGAFDTSFLSLGMNFRF